jgi:hypothetical protein
VAVVEEAWVEVRNLSPRGESRLLLIKPCEIFLIGNYFIKLVLVVDLHIIFVTSTI